MKVTVIVHPNSKKERVGKDLLETLHIYVNQPPLEGKANQATISKLADHFQVSKSQIKLISGAKSKYKIFEINN
jgi:uncharacterized protein